VSSRWAPRHAAAFPGPNQDYGTSTQVPSLPPELRTADVILRPNPVYAERIPGLDRAWGREVRFLGVTINRYCGSGLTAASIAANRIAVGEARIVVAGGVESISLVQSTLHLDGFFYAPLQQRMPAVWWTIPARIPLSYWMFGQRIPSSAPQCARSMMLGGAPGGVTAEGSGSVSTGACGGLISTALMFWANGCSTFAGTYPKPGR